MKPVEEVLMSLKSLDVYVLDRTKEIGVAAYQADSERITDIGQCIPADVFLVAALPLTSMTRMVSGKSVRYCVQGANCSDCGKVPLYACGSPHHAAIGIACLSFAVASYYLCIRVNLYHPKWGALILFSLIKLL